MDEEINNISTSGYAEHTVSLGKPAAKVFPIFESSVF